MKIDLSANELSEVVEKEYQVKAKRDDNNSRLEAISIMICKRDQLLSNKSFHNKENKELLKKMIIFVAYKGTGEDQMIFSIRCLEKIENELYNFTLNSGLTNKIA